MGIHDSGLIIQDLDDDLRRCQLNEDSASVGVRRRSID